MSKAFFMKKSQKIRSSTYSIALYLFGNLHQLLIKCLKLSLKSSKLTYGLELFKKVFYGNNER